MATGSPSDAATLILSLASARPATLGAGRLVCVDGPAGSGKTTLGAELAEPHRCPADPRRRPDGRLARPRRRSAASSTGVVEALAAGRAGSYEHFDWLADRYDRTVEVPPAPWLVVEGVGSGAAALAAYITVLVWVEVDDDLRLARGLERDGEEQGELWRQFMLDERELFARDRIRERADVVVDGTGTRPPVVR